MIEELFEAVDVSFKWILLAFNFLTIVFVYIHKRRNKQQRQHNILLVTAHPDDQCMFFRPTISGLRQTYIVHLLCLSGKDTEREQQLKQAAKVLKIDHVSCVKDQKLVDGMKEKWCEQTIRKYVCQYVQAHKIKAIFTFDKNGVSDHINHKSIYHALAGLQTTQNNESNIKIYYLQSVALPRKYTGLLQFPIAIIKTYSWIQISPFNAYSAMAKHISQFLWFRRLWIFLSRYQYINTYQRAIIKVDTTQN